MGEEDDQKRKTLLVGSRFGLRRGIRKGKVKMIDMWLGMQR